MKKRPFITTFAIISTFLLTISCESKPKEATYYNVTFQNYDGTVLESKQVREGNTPTYKGYTPGKAKDDNYIYKFKGWDPAIEPIYKDTTYTAQYSPIERIVVKWEVNGETVVDDTDIESVCYKGTVPSQKAEGETYYYFDGWTVEEEKNNEEYKKKTYIAKPKFQECTKEDDRDYDGCPDYLDPTPKDSSFNSEIKYMYTEGLDTVTIKNADFKFDYKNMLVDADNTVFNKDLAKLAAIVCFNDVHGELTLTENIKPVQEYKTIFERLGFTTHTTLKPTLTDVDRNDQVKAQVYYQNINSKEYSTPSNDNMRDLFVIKIEYGLKELTDYDEWESNIDIGLYDQEYFDKEGNNHDQGWLDNSQYYKSFYIAALRIKPLITQYIANTKKTNKEPIILLTGHSRCASVANILGAMLNKDNTFPNKLFDYPFAPCFTYWGDTDTENNNIFNICNNDDLVTHFPFDFITDEGKNLNRHGITKSLSISNSLIGTYQNRTNSTYSYVKDPISVLKKHFDGLTRKDIYTCNDVSKLSEDKSVYIDIIKTMNPNLSDEQLNKYFVFEKTSNGLTVKTCLQSYAHACLGLVDKGKLPDKSQMDAALELVNNYYSLGLSLYMRIVGDPVHSIALPHYMTSYYLIADALK